MAVRYQQKCCRCKKNYVPMTWRQKYALCYECQKDELKGEIKDPKMQRMFKIPEKYYKENAFLRNIKMNYLRYSNLTEKQIETFKKVVKQLKDEAKQES